MRKGEKLLFLAGILLAIGALAFSAWKLRGIYGEYQEGEDTYEELASFVEDPRCVRACGQRFGQSMIAGTLLGESTARIRDRGMDKSPVYGKQSKLGKARVQDVIRTMLERGYLCQSKDKYSLLRLTESSERLLEQTQPFCISYKREEEKAGRKTKASADCPPGSSEGWSALLQRRSGELHHL